MQYFKNSQLVKLYPVSESAVRHWIEAARQGKSKLTLHEQGGKRYIANTAKNLAIIDEMVKERKKYATKGTRKTVSPTPEFYELYSSAQVFHIFSNIAIYREIPLQYSYFNGGAQYWDEYANRLAAEDVPNMLNSTVQLFDMSRSYLDALLGDYKSVNVIDIGPGNCLPVKDLLAHLLEQGILGRYIAMDISEEMLRVAERNIKAWFGNRVQFEGHVRDVSHERFAEFLAEESLGTGSGESLNLALLLGGTLSNFRRPGEVLEAVRNNMGQDDLLIYMQKLDSLRSRLYFDFNTQSGVVALSADHLLVLDLLNIDESFYSVEMGFDESKRERYIRARLKVALTIEFDSGKDIRRIALDAGDAILLWRFHHQTAPEITADFDRSGFDVLHTSRTKDKDYMLLVSSIKTGQPD
jgi:uncharacterized SAM-dependent methyltransferase